MNRIVSLIAAAFVFAFVAVPVVNQAAQIVA